MTDQAVVELARRAGLQPTAIEQALDWLVSRWSKEMSAGDEQALAQWRAADTENERAWQRVQGLESNLAAAVAPMGGQRLRAARSRIGRRAVVKSLALIALGSAGSYGLLRSDVVQTQLADMRTATGEIRNITLADGTRLTLNTRSAVDIEFDAYTRRLRLLAGEIAIVTAKDGARPFVVDTTAGTIMPIGTSFTVRQTGDDAHVAVEEGAVLVQPRSAAHSVRIDAGQQMQFNERAAGLTETLVEASVAWRRGMLVVERWRLADFLAEVARYRHGVVRCDPSIADLIVSGAYPLADTDRILVMLAGILPVRIDRILSLWVAVRPRQK